MIEANVVKNSITLTEKEQMTSGSVNVYHVHFHFSSHWDDLEKVAIFKTPTTIINVPIEDGSCVVPWEVTTTPGLIVDLGVYGIKASQVILPTVWVRLGTIVEGVFIGEAESGDHTPDIYDAILSKIQELLDKFGELEDDVRDFRDDVPTDDEIFALIVRYLKENPQIVDKSTIEKIIKEYLDKNPIEGVTPEQVNNLIEQYLTNNQVGITSDQVTDLIKQYLINNQVGITEERVQEMIDASVGAAITDGY